jgi:tRNA G18 (ribose-2'-O)-methylase SpoU
MRSNVNLSHIVRLAGCAAVQKVIACGHAKLIEKIARDGADTVRLEIHRTLPPVLKELKSAGYQLVGLEQTTNSEKLYDFHFERRTALVVGNERLGLTEDELALVDRIAEIPVFGLPYAYNVHTSVAMAVYEYCRQYPHG